MTSTTSVPPPGRGRPRKKSPHNAYASPVDEILSSASRLFVEHGFAATTTRAITDAVGVRQGVIYYHFASKDDILLELLRRIIARPLRLGERLAVSNDIPSAVRLAALVRGDAHELLAAEHNIGSLFLLPEVRRPEFQEFRQMRERLRAIYLRLISESMLSEVLAPFPSDDSDPTCHLTSYLTDAIFGLVESVISIREDRPVANRELMEAAVQVSALRILGYTAERLTQVVDAAAHLVEALADEVPPIISSR